MTKTTTLCLLALLSLALSAPAAFAQGLDTPFCGIPEGCDLDGDGVVETPAGTIAPSEGQYPEDPPPVEAPQTGPAEQTGNGTYEPPATVPEVYPRFDAAYATPSQFDATYGSRDSTVDYSSATPSGSEVSASVAQQPVSVARAAAPSGLLPDTGGAPLGMLGAAGMLLLAGGLLLCRVGRQS